MKNFLIILLALLIGAGGGYFAWKYFVTKDDSGGSVSQTTDDESFLWGVTMRPTGLGKYSDSIWSKQLKVASNLGVKWVRIDWTHDAEDEFTYHDNIIDYLKQFGLNVYLVIEPTGKFENVRNPYQDGYDNAYKIATHYKGQIKYYQIMNEASSNAIKGGTYSGEDESDYDATKYERTKEWLRGASEGIKKADANAQRVLTSQWTHTAFLDKLAQDNIEYDIIGWNWFSDMGYLGDKKLSDGTLLIDKLKSFNKPVILAEINYRPEGVNGQNGQPESKQADFIEKMAQWSVKTGLKGFFVLELLDSPNSGKGYTDYYGIVGVTKSSSGAYIPDEPRQAYETYQKIISRYSK